jgi:hypothetical protein
MLALRAELEASKLEQTRLQVQSELKVPAALMKFLTGTDYEGLAASARELMAHVKPEDPSKVTIGSGTPPGGTLPPNAGEIEAKVKAGLEKAKKINESFAGSKDERRAY